MKLLLTGATGAVGLQVLRLAIADPAISSITILSRRPLPDYTPGSSKAEVIVLDDFLSYPPEILPRLADQDACIWALGGSSKGHTEESYEVFTVGYVKAAVEALIKSGVGKGKENGKNPFRFIFLSGEYANPEESSMFMFARVKGRAEKYLLDLPQSSGIKGSTVRPMWFFPPPQDAAHRRTSSQRLVHKVFWPMISTVAPWMCTPIDEMSRVMVEMAKGRWGDESVFGNVRLKELMAEN